MFILIQREYAYLQKQFCQHYQCCTFPTLTTCNKWLDRLLNATDVHSDRFSDLISNKQDIYSIFIDFFNWKSYFVYNKMVRSLSEPGLMVWFPKKIGWISCLLLGTWHKAFPIGTLPCSQWEQHVFPMEHNKYSWRSYRRSHRVYNCTHKYCLKST